MLALSGSLATQWAHSGDSDQAGRMPFCWFCHTPTINVKIIGITVRIHCHSYYHFLHSSDESAIKSWWMYLIIISHYSVGVLTQVFNEDTLRTIKPQNPQPFTEAGSFKVLLRAKVRSIRTPPQSLFLVVNKYVNRVINIMDVTEKNKESRTNHNMVKSALITGHQSQLNGLRTLSDDFSRTWNGSKIWDL